MCSIVEKITLLSINNFFYSNKNEKIVSCIIMVSNNVNKINDHY